MVDIWFICELAAAAISGGTVVRFWCAGQVTMASNAYRQAKLDLRMVEGAQREARQNHSQIIDSLTGQLATVSAEINAIKMRRSAAVSKGNLKRYAAGLNGTAK